MEFEVPASIGPDCGVVDLGVTMNDNIHTRLAHLRKGHPPKAVEGNNVRSRNPVAIFQLRSTSETGIVSSA
jgi:hypothetical protein